jgi:hypothetical protein
MCIHTGISAGRKLRSYIFPLRELAEDGSKHYLNLGVLEILPFRTYQNAYSTLTKKARKLLRVRLVLKHWIGTDTTGNQKITDFSVVLFRPNFMLVSEGYPMKMHKNQWVLNTLFPPDIPWGAIHHGTTHGVWGADTFAVT